MLIKNELESSSMKLLQDHPESVKLLQGRSLPVEGDQGQTYRIIVPDLQMSRLILSLPLNVTHQA